MGQGGIVNLRLVHRLLLVSKGSQGRRRLRRGRTSMVDSSGRRNMLMNFSWLVATTTVVRSQNGVTSTPISRSRSPCTRSHPSWHTFQVAQQGCSPSV